MTEYAQTFSEYPDDNQFVNNVIKKVDKESNGWSITFEDGFSFYVPQPSPIEPTIGSVARLYGKGLGYVVRGLFINGQKVFYRTEKEDKEKTEIDLYGIDAIDWLRRWDEGQSVWSIEMGGFGPGYEQAIQITVAEILRYLLKEERHPELWHEDPVWEKLKKGIDDYSFENKIIKKLGLSGAQYGAAFSLAIRLYVDGPRAIMNNEKVKDRRIQVSRHFPVVE